MGDEGSHHQKPDEKRRLLVHGLLTATLPTKIGGEHDVLARTMDFFIPVYTDDTITCVAKIEKPKKQENNRTAIFATFPCTNKNGKEVLKGNITGVILLSYLSVLHSKQYRYL